MTDLSTVAVTTGTLPVPGARLYYEVRGSGPLVVLAAAPMDADAFAPLAGLLATDHTVLTTDPRGIHRSPLDDPAADSTPELRAGDLARLIAHVGAGPAVALGSSGGAVSVLALAEHHPDAVRAVIAHEPPLTELLPDRGQLREQLEDMRAAHLAGDVRGSWVRFMATANIRMPDEVFEMMFGGERTPRQAADEHYQFAHMLRGTSRWQPDVPRLRDGAPRVVVGIGVDSAGELCDRSSRALAAALGTGPVMFPGGHIGFAENPAAFACALRPLIDAS